MLTIQQCRAARGLLGWTQQDLAEAAGLSKTAINNFEKGHSDIKTESLRAIRMAFESANIEFIGDNGLRKKVETVRTLKGKGAIAQLMEDILETLRISGGEVLAHHIDDPSCAPVLVANLGQSLEKFNEYGISLRAVCASAPPDLDLGPALRLNAAGTSSMGTPTFLYGQKASMILWDHSMIMIVNSPEASAAGRRRFESLWASAQQYTPENSNATSLIRARGT